MIRAAESGLVGFLEFDDDSHIHEANATLSGWLDYGDMELEGQRFDQLLDGGGRFYYQSQILPVLKLSGHLEEIYLTLLSKKGEPVPVLVNLQRCDQTDRPHFEAAILRIKDRARLENELLIAKKKAEAAIEARSRFLAMMSHELRTPLQTILFSSKLILEESVGPLTEDQKELLEAVSEGSTDLARLIDDVLNFAKLQNGNVPVEPVEIAAEAVLKRAETLVKPAMKEAGLSYERMPVPEDLVLRADPDRLQQILLNLLNNAVKFTPTGGVIATAAEAVGKQIYLKVQDSGIGIPEEDYERIFDPFVQLEPGRSRSEKKGGVGLGLAICRQLARAMSGDLTVNSEPSQGATFTVILPRP